MDNIMFDAILYETDNIFDAMSGNTIRLNDLELSDIISLLIIEDKVDNLHVACFPHFKYSED